MYSSYQPYGASPYGAYNAGYGAYGAGYNMPAAASPYLQPAAQPAYQAQNYQQPAAPAPAPAPAPAIIPPASNNPPPTAGYNADPLLGDAATNPQTRQNLAKALRKAAENGNTVMVMRLLRLADLLNTEPDESPLVGAVANGHLNVVQLLLTKHPMNERGVRVLIRAFFIAVQRGFEDIARELYSRRPQLATDIDENGYSALIYAVDASQYSITKFLLDHGARVNALAPRETALHIAVNHGTLAMVNLLLEYKADPTVDDLEGKSAVRRARERGDAYITSAVEARATALSRGNASELYARGANPSVQGLFSFSEELKNQNQQQQQQRMQPPAPHHHQAPPAAAGAAGGASDQSLAAALAASKATAEAEEKKRQMEQEEALRYYERERERQRQEQERQRQEAEARERERQRLEAAQRERQRLERERLERERAEREQREREQREREYTPAETNEVSMSQETPSTLYGGPVAPRSPANRAEGQARDSSYDYSPAPAVSAPRPTPAPAPARAQPRPQDQKSSQPPVPLSAEEQRLRDALAAPTPENMLHSVAFANMDTLGNIIPPEGPAASRSAASAGSGSGAPSTPAPVAPSPFSYPSYGGGSSAPVTPSGVPSAVPDPYSGFAAASASRQQSAESKAAYGGRAASGSVSGVPPTTPVPASSSRNAPAPSPAPAPVSAPVVSYDAYGRPVQQSQAQAQQQQARPAAQPQYAGYGAQQAYGGYGASGANPYGSPYPNPQSYGQPQAQPQAQQQPSYGYPQSSYPAAGYGSYGGASYGAAGFGYSAAPRYY